MVRAERYDGPGAETGCDLSGTTAVILAGGLGTRLRSVLPDRPKILAEVGGVPFVFHLLCQLTRAGLKHVVLCVGHLGDQVQRTVGSAYGPLVIEYSHEAVPLGTAGALRRALPLMGSSSVLALNGDSFCELDLLSLWTWHHLRPAHATLALARVDDARRFGTVATGEFGRIVSFVEKSSTASSGEVNAGLYVIRRALVASIPAGQPLSLERDVFPQWLDVGLYGYARTGRFIDIGTPESLERAQSFFPYASGYDAGAAA